MVKLAQQYMSTKGAAAPPTLVRVAPSLFKRVDAPGANAPSPAAAAVALPSTTAALSGTTSPVAAKAAAAPQHITLELPPLAPGHGSVTAASAQGGQSSSSPGPRQQQQGSGADEVARGEQGPGPSPSAAAAALRPGLLEPSPGLAELLGMGGGAGGGGGGGGAPVEEADDGTCVICFDAQASCVLLECGHGGFCTRCAHVLMVRPPNVCPSCRRPIEQVGAERARLALATREAACVLCARAGVRIGGAGVVC